MEFKNENIDKIHSMIDSHRYVDFGYFIGTNTFGLTVWMNNLKFNIHIDTNYNFVNLTDKIEKFLKDHIIEVDNALSELSVYFGEKPIDKIYKKINCLNAIRRYNL